ncbi:PfkB family carbohydrate kinase [Boseongicola sp. H5]|uniref:carbohydrate kinase family protein n=1 Tax=Boseongicola sp. H5 TaxID=2763261 RepID=UPI001B2B6520|nr:PfkB family carbohydrate kinase [Boseongicola sp. H5]MBO6921960.1 hypothetical protein [Roseicyclus sp.]
MTDILALGQPMVEFVRLPDLLDGRPVYRQGFGGDTSNAIIAAARQGARTDNEATTLLETADEAGILNRFGAHGAKVVILKRGAKSPVIRTAGETFEVAVPRVTAVDSTGAGDSFAGGWLAYYLETGDARVAAVRAARVAASTVLGYGAVHPIPHRSDMVKS